MKAVFTTQQERNNRHGFGHLPDSATWEEREPHELLGRDVYGTPERSFTYLGRIKVERVENGPQSAARVLPWNFVRQDPSEKQKTSLDVILGHVFISRVVYLSSYNQLMGQLAGLPWARLSWEAGPLAMGPFLPGCFQHCGFRIPRERAQKLRGSWGPETSFLPISIGKNNL